MRIYLNLFTAVIIMCSGCEEYELNKSVFIPDPQFSSLPTYSEFGYNTFGAFYDRDVFVYTDNETPGKIVNTGGKTYLFLTGQRGEPFYAYGQETKTMNLSFTIPDFEAGSYVELLSLNGRIVDLTDPDCSLSLNIDNINADVQVMSGNFYFTKTRFLKVDDEISGTIIAGTFNFTAVINGVPVNVSNGRFDLLISELNFFTVH